MERARRFGYVGLGNGFSDAGFCVQASPLIFRPFTDGCRSLLVNGGEGFLSFFSLRVVRLYTSRWCLGFLDPAFDSLDSRECGSGLDCSLWSVCSVWLSV